MTQLIVEVETVTIPKSLWEAMAFFIQGAAILGVFKQAKPGLHEQVVAMSQLIDTELEIIG
jgi:hypothetical protein